MILETLSAMRDIGRLHDIASILIRYGFGDLVQRLGLEPVLEKAGRALNWTGFEELLKLDTPQQPSIANGRLYIHAGDEVVCYKIAK